MTTIGRPYGDRDPAHYWNDRARRFGGQGSGLGAVCSYGMPLFYNRAIELTQRRALRRALAVPQGTTVLDAGCGVGRWSLRLAARGALVTGVDHSSTMVAEARRRCDAAGLTARCTFRTVDLAELDTGGEYQLVLAVTVLQHILDGARLVEAIDRLRAHLAPAGRLVVLEAAPGRRLQRCDSPVFRARSAATYKALFASSGLEVMAVTGVDPVPLKTWLLPFYREMPRAAGRAALFAATALSLPVDLVVGRPLAHWSWHKVFHLRHRRGALDGS